MRWFPNISFASASSSPVTSPAGDSHRRRKSSDDNSNHRRGIWRFGSRYTRQRKLQNISNDRDSVGASSSGWPDSTVETLGLSRSAASSYTQSVPLPVPEFPGNSLRRSTEDADCPLPSPKAAGPSRSLEQRDIGDVIYTNRVTNRIGNGQLSNNVPIRSVFSCPERQIKKDHAQARPSSRGVNQDPNCSSERPQVNFGVEVPTRSCPTSAFSSPAISPKRTKANDMPPYYYYMAPKGNQAWSAPEIPISPMIVGASSPALFDCCAFSTDTSPIQSPRGRSPLRDPKSPNRYTSTSPLHPKLSLETSTAWRENAGPSNVHPLPLPPGASSMPSSSATNTPPLGSSMPSSSATNTPPRVSSMPSPSAPSNQLAAKPELVPMKNQWQKGKLIGRGTFGSVYVASNRGTGALCAMKEVELFPDDPKSAESIKQLEQEIKILSHLKHPNIVQYYGSEIVEDRFYIYLEYVHPGSINKYVREHCGAITESVVRNFTRHILLGLAYLHSTKTIHRDIKGANLLVDSFGVVKLADFGMSKHLTGQAADLSLKGSPYWMAPELMQAVMQKDNNPDLALAVDVWSLGCTIIEMLTGKPPWSGYEGAAAMFKVMRDAPSIPESLSSEGKDFLSCCFLRNPGDRPTAAMLLEHRFVKNSLQLEIPCQELSGMNLMDKPHSPGERCESKPDHLPTYPSSQITKGNVISESETGQQSHHELSDSKLVVRYSPRSTLEILPTLSPSH